MSESGEETKIIVAEYAKLKIKDEYGEGESPKETKLRAAMNEKLRDEIFEKIIKDIYNLQKNKITKEVQEKLRQEEEEKKRSQIKFILIEGIILGLITGLLVNQITDIISYLKGNNNYSATSWIILILGILAALFAFIVYLNKLEEFFTNKKKNKETE